MAEIVWRWVRAILLTGLGCTAVPCFLWAQDLPPIMEASPLSESRTHTVPVQQLTIEARIARIEGLLEGQALVDMMMRLEELQKEVQTLRGEVEVQQHTLTGLKQRQRELYLDVDRRLRQGMVPGSQTPVAGSGQPGESMPSISTVDATAGSLPVTGNGVVVPAGEGDKIDPLKEQAAYQQAFTLLKNGKYDQAISGFQTFLEQYPQGDFSGNAQYWLGEANYVSKKYLPALEEFNKVLSLYPQNQKVPDTLLKMGYAYYELKNWDLSREMLNKLVNTFPKSTAAQLAQNRLHKMKLEGR